MLRIDRTANLSRLRSAPAAEGIRERSDLRQMIKHARAVLQELGGYLLVVRSTSPISLTIASILAIDETGNCVVIELERAVTSSTAKAIAYAGMVAMAIRLPSRNGQTSGHCKKTPKMNQGSSAAIRRALITRSGSFSSRKTRLRGARRG